MTLTLSQLRQYLPAAPIRAAGDFLVTGMSIDTRSLKPGDIFVALSGERVDGHQFVQKAAERGASAAVVEEFVDVDIPQIQVDDAVVAMGQIASAWRDICAPRAIAVTGSNGKTTVKQMLGAIFMSCYGRDQVLITEGNLNNHLGVPLMLSRLTEETKVSILEHGANHPLEIEYLAGLSKPEIAIVTNAGPAHLEGFGSVAGVAKAKGELISSLGDDGIAVLNADDQYLSVWLELADNRSVVLFGFSDDADIKVVNFTNGLLQLSYRNSEVKVEVEFEGAHNALNLAGAVAVAVAAGLDFESSVRAAATFEQVGGRYQVVPGITVANVIDDTYNANPASVMAGMQSLPAEDERWLVLGAMGELGSESDALHHQVGEQARTLGIKRLFVFGETAAPVVEAFGQNGALYKSQELLLNDLRESLQALESGDGVNKPWVLVKGSRSAVMENIIKGLKESNEC